ncbi:hypothetical protein [Luteolibacter sp. Populi]|uniref:hypothetical protein n=1 Tax=Luteolibacter sp. Populi TaxID=3230487 RepID=UPI003466C039
MKTSRMAALAAVLLATGVSAPRALFAQSTNPSIPVGTLSAFPKIVQPGTHPTLTWNISYPSIVQDYVKVNDPSDPGGGGGDTYIEPKVKLKAKVRVIGAGVTVAQSGSNNFSFVPTEAQLSFNGGTYSRIFYNTNPNVNPATVVWSRATSSTYVNVGQKLRFGGRYFYNNSWGPYFNSQSGTKNVRILVNGEMPPTTYPLHNAPTLESFLKPYLDAAGRVKIGPMDCIVFMELTHHDSQISDQGYDLQDMVLLVTFETL